MKRILVGVVGIIVTLLAGCIPPVNPPSSPAIYYVDCNSQSAFQDGTAAHPYWTIQRGIDAAASTGLRGYNVHVASGTYHERLVMADGVVLAGAGWQSTVIDGGGGAGHVIEVPTTVRSGLVDGFTITGGGSGWYDSGIWCQGSYLIISNNRIQNNGGRGVSAYTGSSPDIRGNVIVNNGISGIYCFDSHPSIINNTVDGNIGEAGLTLHDTTAVVKNNIVTGNAKGILTLGDATGLSFSYNDVWNNVLNYDWGPNSPQPTGLGTMSSNPMYVDRAQGKYGLRPGSPCVDAGDPTMGSHPDSGNRYDMGALESLP